MTMICTVSCARCDAYMRVEANEPGDLHGNLCVDCTDELSSKSHLCDYCELNAPTCGPYCEQCADEVAELDAKEAAASAAVVVRRAA